MELKKKMKKKLTCDYKSLYKYWMLECKYKLILYAIKILSINWTLIII